MTTIQAAEEIKIEASSTVVTREAYESFAGQLGIEALSDSDIQRYSNSAATVAEVGVYTWRKYTKTFEDAALGKIAASLGLYRFDAICKGL